MFNDTEGTAPGADFKKPRRQKASAAVDLSKLDRLPPQQVRLDAEGLLRLALRRDHLAQAVLQHREVFLRSGRGGKSGSKSGGKSSRGHRARRKAVAEAARSGTTSLSQKGYGQR